MIEFRNVTKRFGLFTAVEVVDLAVARGEFLTLLGPSGCGKTTLLRMLSGFETPTDGTVHIDGSDVTHVPPYRRNVNQVFQSYALFPHLNVEQNIAFGLRMQKLPKGEIARRVAEAIQLVALNGFEKRRPHELSGGQRQRVALARAIVPKPDVLLLDEPLSALDAKLRRSMQIELKRLQRQLGLTTVFVTHDQEEALTMSDRIAVMNRGRIEQLGTPGDIYHRPATTFVADFIGEANSLDVELERGGEPAVGTMVGRVGDVVSAGRVIVRTESGLRLLAAGAVGAMSAAAPTAKAVATIRPEKVHVSKAALQGENVFRATITEEVFQGATDHLTLKLEGGITLKALVTNESAIIEALHEGDEVFCAIHPEDVYLVFPSERETRQRG